MYPLLDDEKPHPALLNDFQVSVKKAGEKEERNDRKKEKEEI